MDDRRIRLGRLLSRIFGAAILFVGAILVVLGCAEYSLPVPFSSQRISSDTVSMVGGLIFVLGIVATFLPFRVGLAAMLFIYTGGTVFLASYRPPVIGDWSETRSGKKIIHTSASAWYEVYTQSDDKLGNAGLPNAVSRHFDRDFDVSYSLDGEGYRWTPIPTGPSPHPLVLFLGCSFTFGQGVRDDQCFPAILASEAWTNSKVSNRALPGWGTTQACLILESALARGERPACVFYGFFPHHQARNHRRESWHRGRGSRIPLFDPKTDTFGVVEPSDANLPDSPELDEMEREVTIELIRRMRDQCQRVNAPFFMLIFSADDSEGMRRIREEPGIGVIDLTAACSSLYPHDGHPDPLAHRAMAKVIAADSRLTRFHTALRGVEWKDMDPEEFQLRLTFGDPTVDANMSRLPNGGVHLEKIRSPRRESWGVALWKWCQPLRKGVEYELFFQARAEQQRPIGLLVTQRASPHGNRGLAQNLQVGTAWANFKYRWVCNETDNEPMIRFELGESEIPFELAAVILREAPRDESLESRADGSRAK